MARRPDVVVARRGPLSGPVRWVLLVCGVVALGWAAFEYGQRRAGYDSRVASRLRAELEARNTELEAENKTLSERVAVLETAAKVDREAYRRVEAELAELQDRILQQQEDIEFYRGIVDEADGAELRIQDFAVRPGLQPGRFELRLVLAQALRSNRPVEGRVELSLEGLQRNKRVRLGLDELGADEPALEYSFRYFQDLRAGVTLPPGFVPERVRVVVRPQGKTAETVEEFYVWRVDTG